MYVIALIISAAISVYEENSFKENVWNEYISMYQALPLPETSQIVEFKVFDKASVPFDITIKYISQESYADELTQYLPLLEKHQLTDVIQREDQYEYTNKERRIHFSFKKQGTEYVLRLSNGSW